MNPEHGPIEIRAAVVDAVAYPKRLLDVIAVPYDQWTPVPYNGKIIEESVAPGAFGDIGKRAGRFLVNLEHEPDRWLGRIIGFPADPSGLRARLQIRRTPEGDQALDDAADGMLGASVGMAVRGDGQTIADGRRRIVKAFLDHVALTAQPAYAGAEVLDVRHRPSVTPASATPNLDRVLAQRRAGP